MATYFSKCREPGRVACSRTPYYVSHLKKREVVCLAATGSDPLLWKPRALPSRSLFLAHPRSTLLRWSFD